jgi:alanyl-tRNA synthetase
MKSTREIRDAYIQYFVERDHRHVSSWPLVPPTDPTVLFTVAGMVQFKPYYSGTVPLPYRRATSCQKCLRAGGKGSDLENVGRTIRHHTFFEMLGNFSFGDYFKREAITWGWDFSTRVVGLDPKRIYITVFRDDDEAYDIWHKEVGLAADRIFRMGEKDNFWGPAGNTGACGPSTELYYDLGPACGPETPRQGIAEGESERYLEYWNLVFPQFDQQPDGSRPPLKNRGIDTGLGLERTAAILQGVSSTYETDVFKPIVDHACDLIGVRYGESKVVTLSINVIADHIRALTFALSEGVLPSNQDRGYVLRRILRRALRHSRKIGCDRPFLFSLVDTVVDVMGGAYSEIKEHPKQVQKVIRLEEERFSETLDQGTDILDRIIDELKAGGRSVISGEDAFQLYDTYGFPVDLTLEIAEEKGLTVDQNRFQVLLAEQKQRSREAGREGGREDRWRLLDDVVEEFGNTRFVGYEKMECETTVLALLEVDQVGNLPQAPRTEVAEAGWTGDVVLSDTPFYAEAGGQVGDRGRIVWEGGEAAVLDTRKTPSELFLHRAKITAGRLRVGDVVSAEIDRERRWAIMRNHTATHLLQGALKRIVGTHVTQSGSYVGPDDLRFDFTHLEALTPEQIERAEQMVNEQIVLDTPVVVETLPLDEARKKGAIAPFGEKYGATVRVVEVPGFSMEFCGGTHLDRTGRIGSFLITSESSIASGIRRIEAVTGLGALGEVQRQRAILRRAGQMLSAAGDDIPSRIEALQEANQNLRKRFEQARQTGLAAGIEQAIAEAVEVAGVRIVVARLDGLDADALRQASDLVRSKCKSFVAILASVAGERASLLCAVDKAHSKQLPAKELINEIGAIAGLRGGGRPELAQAGGLASPALDQALAKAAGLVTGKLAR